MTIELSTITFTDQDDIVPVSGVEQIFNTGIANTFAGNDIITGTVDRYSIPTALQIDGFPDWWPGRIPGIYNDTGGVIDTGDGNDVITGISQDPEGIIRNYSDGILNRGIINSGNGNDIITGIAQGSDGHNGIINRESEGIINTGDGDDTIMGTGPAHGIVISYNSTLDTGKGNDIIVGTGSIGFYNTSATFNTGDGNDTITGNSTDYIFGLYNGGFMDTGNGDDIITSIGLFYNTGTINTGNGNDSIITEGGFSSSINTINGRFFGSMFLGNDKDYLKGFGKGIFNGGNGKDTLELTPGNYTIGRSEATVNFINGNTIMETSDFEILIAGNTTYRIRSLTEGQTIFVA